MARLGDKRRAPIRALRSEFLIEAARMALERWDRLAPDEQQRFRELATAARGNPAVHLSPDDERDLNRLWKRLEARKLLREILRRAARPTPTV